MEITKEQKNAIGQRGQVIVSAAAGSGKTFVMIERLVRLILGGESVKNVLAVTFTNKAAAQMRRKLRDALIDRMSGKAEGEPLTEEERTRVKEELLALPLADISTIHAFCGRLVRTNFFLAGVDAGFRIIDSEDAEGQALASRALDEVFEEEYETMSEDFKRLLAAYYRSKKDSSLRKIVTGLHEKVRGLSSYRDILARVGQGELFQTACDYLFTHYHDRVTLFKNNLEEALVFFKEEKHDKAIEMCEIVLEACNRLYKAQDLFELCGQGRGKYDFPTTPKKDKKNKDEKYRHLTNLGRASAELKEMQKEFNLTGTRKEEEERYLAADGLAAAIATLVLRFDDAYARLKKEMGVLDYNDLEQLALLVLKNKDAREAAKSRYRYVLVDEYQDVNPVQEEIISLLTGEELFLVGDGKQAIYGFRGSKSSYFYKQCATLPHSLPLNENFRSSKAVLAVVNRVFKPLIGGYTRVEGGRRYRQELGGGQVHEHLGQVYFHYIPKSESEKKKPQDVYSVRANGKETVDDLAERVGDIIEKEIKSGEWFDTDEVIKDETGEEKQRGAVKRVRFGDIAILSRTNSGISERILHVLARRDIPVTTTSKVNVCDFFEARLLIDCLSYLDNAEQDIPLATAMTSALGGFTEDELAKIRLYYPNTHTFRKACALYAQKSLNEKNEEKDEEIVKKLHAFYEKFHKLRDEARTQTAAETAVRLLAEGLEAQIVSKNEGEIRLARVRHLIADGESCPNVHAFLARLKAVDYNVEYAGGGGDNAVKVLTMHSSKGLEYPVVILAGLDKSFHGAETDEMRWTEQFLFAPHYFDTEKMIRYDTVTRRAAALVQKQEELDGERNLLYVAMTRARHRLHMLFGDVKERAPSPDQAKRFSDFLPDVTETYSDFFTGDLSSADFSSGVQGAAGGEAAKAKEEPAPAGTVPDPKGEISAAYNRPYMYEKSVLLPVKTSATELMRSLHQPVFVRDTADTGGGFTVDTGSAYHAFLENVRFGEDAEKELSRMKKEGILSKEYLALLEADKLKSILAIPCFKGLAGKRLYREQTFLIRLPACEILDTDVTDEIVYQGAIDLLVEGENGYEIIDYKYSSHDDERIQKDYALQIKLYKKAVAHAMHVREDTISARIINIARGREIPM